MKEKQFMGYIGRLSHEENIYIHIISMFIIFFLAAL